MHDTHTSLSEEDTLALGRKIGKELKLPVVVLLFGDLGAGKTVLTRGIAEGLGLRDSSLVHSPTFSLVNEYQTLSCGIRHIDLYRLDSLQDQYSIGFSLLGNQGSKTISFIYFLIYKPSYFVLLYGFLNPHSVILSPKSEINFDSLDLINSQIS